jgi:hypothetical protein
VSIASLLLVSLLLVSLLLVSLLTHTPEEECELRVDSIVFQHSDEVLSRGAVGDKYLYECISRSLLSALVGLF